MKKSDLIIYECKKEKTCLFGTSYRKMFIAFDGIDGAGKSTIYKKIAHELEKNYSVQVFDMGCLGFLDDIIEGIKKGKYLCSAEIRECIYYFEGCLFSDLIVGKYLKDKYKHILIDRYLLSFLSYGPLNGVSIDKVSLLTSKMKWPDYYFYVDVQPEIALNRIKNKRNIVKPEIGYKNELETNEKENHAKFISHQTLVRKNFKQAIQFVGKKVYSINNHHFTSFLIKKVSYRTF
ncbi:thymidylate kinase [Lachnospiraceae bacterium]|nr:thymidylate kinase [Lachnospiraceae bacterium]